MADLRDEISRTLTQLTRDSTGAEKRNPAPLPDTRVGRQLGAYRILRRLGAGGMGQVYLALDTHLGRHVALKFLAPELISDQVSLMRLVQEARAASALNHPNILTIYEVGELEGEPFIASEFVEGVTLRTLMERSALNLDAILDIAGQIASALHAAHAAGVIHRDLKPANIMLRPDGYVKVIDFGLAKRLAQNEAETRTDYELTRPGTTIGTVEYMSPEQARGDEVDFRTDIWSFGVILYELLAGQRPFQGPSQSHILVAIQDQPTPPLPSGNSVSARVQNVIARALAKDPKERFGSVLEMWGALEAATGRSQGSGRMRIVAPSPKALAARAKRWPFLSIVAVAILVAAALLWSRWRQPYWLTIDPLRQLTFNGRTRLAVISPNGNYLAYTAGQPDGEQALYLKQINAAADELKIPPRRINYRGLTFSPDNQTLYVVEKDESLMGRLYVVPLLGTRPAPPIIVDIDGPVSFSPTGAQFVYVKHNEINGNHGASTKSTLMLASRDGQTLRQLVSTSDVYLYRQPVWSSDGKRIAVFGFDENSHAAGHAFLELLKLDGSASRRLLPDWQTIGQSRWSSDGNSLIVAVGTYSEPNKRSQLHQLAVATGADHALTNDLAGYSEPSLSENANTLTAIKTDSKAVIWISRQNDFTHGETVPGEAERVPALAWADDSLLIVNSRRNGFPNLAVLDAQTQSFSALTNSPSVEQGVAVIPGTAGRCVVFSSNRSGEFHIWRFDAGTNKLRQLTSGATYDEKPAVSPDGRWIVYIQWSQNEPRLRKVPAAGGGSVAIGSFHAEDAQISPDGKWIACYLQNPSTGKWTAAIVPFDGNGEPRALPGVSMPLHWSPSGNSITTVLTDARGVSNVWRVPLNGRAAARLTAFEDRIIEAFAWSPGGDRLACLRTTVGADVALFKTTNNQ